VRDVFWYGDAGARAGIFISATVSLDQTMQHIAELDVQIGDLSGKLDVAKQHLSAFVAEDYKMGKVSLIDLLLNSADLNDFVSRIVYANKVAERQRSAIDEVDSLYTQVLTQRAELEQAKIDQQNYITAQSESLAAANEAAARAQQYYDQLSAEVRQGVEQAREVERAEAKAESLEILATLIEHYAAEQEAAGGEGAAQGEYQVEYQGEPLPEGVPGVEDGGWAAPEADPYGITNALSDADTQQLIAEVSQTLGSDVAQQLASLDGNYGDMLGRVYDLLGSGYQYSGYSWTGDTDSSAFTCSGVVDYALGRDSQSSSPESLYEEVGSNMVYDVDQLQEGDLVFYSYGDREVGHVGVYIGEGQVIDSIPDGGVAIRDVDYMDVVGGGSLG